ncbi:unnamed protein product, partial [Rodentolepis nana]|uniref:Collagen-like protein n=1 Tax=Rodentolepis nana TaxID=102285 RepID=A0A0R3TJ89_RODNA
MHYLVVPRYEWGDQEDWHHSSESVNQSGSQSVLSMEVMTIRLGELGQQEFIQHWPILQDKDENVKPTVPGAGLPAPEPPSDTDEENPDEPGEEKPGDTDEGNPDEPGDTDEENPEKPGEEKPGDTDEENP